MDDPAHPHGFGPIVADLKSQIRQFLQTRLAILKVEMREKGRALKLAGPLFGVALLLVGTSYFLLTLSSVTLVAASFLTIRIAGS